MLFNSSFDSVRGPSVFSTNPSVFFIEELNLCLVFETERPLTNSSVMARIVTEEGNWEAQRVKGSDYLSLPSASLLVQDAEGKQCPETLWLIPIIPQTLDLSL